MLQLLTILCLFSLAISLLTPPDISTSYTAFYSIESHSSSDVVEGRIWRDAARGLERRFMSAVVPDIDAPADYSVFSLNEAALWNFIVDENSTLCNRTVFSDNNLPNFFEFLQTPSISYAFEGDIERWFLSQGFYVSLTVNRNERNRPLVFSFGPTRAMAANISINCWDGDAPLEGAFYLPSSCNGTCSGCTNVYSPESMVCPSSGIANTVEYILLLLSLLVVFCYIL